MSYPTKPGNPPPPPPGYSTSPQYGQQPYISTAPGTTYVTQQVVTTHQRGSSMAGMRKAIPELPMAFAITCCVINCVLVGFGTIIAGFGVLCCGNVGESGGSRFATFCINFWVGIAQIITLTAFPVGWIWSIMWGVAFIAIAGEAKKREQGGDTTITTTTYQAPAGFPQVSTNPPQAAPTNPPQAAPTHYQQAASTNYPQAALQSQSQTLPTIYYSTPLPEPHNTPSPPPYEKPPTEESIYEEPLSSTNRI